MQLKIPSLRWMLLAFLAVPLVWLSGWLLFAHFAGISSTSVSELSGLLAAIGGMMGAIFTVGGLVIALVAVLSQITLEDRAKRVMEDKFNELAPDLERRADRRIAGRIAFRDAQEALQTQDWEAAEQLAHEALEQYPDLPGVRSTVALRMTDVVQVTYLSRVYNSSHRNEAFYRQIDAARQAQPLTAPPEAPKAAAIEWLQEAMSHHDDPDGRVSAAQALVYGLNEAYEKMLAAARRGIAINPARRTELRAPQQLIMLTHACRNDPDRVRRFGEVLDLRLPAAVETVRASVEQIDKGRIDGVFVDWYALDHVLPGQAVPELPVTLRIFRMREESGMLSASASIFYGGRREEQFPASDPNAVNAPPPRLPLDDLISRLADRFVMLCPTE
ncbi:MAG TPA: hypothetical protein VF916_02305 [Ktedonobacterales bacterium]